MASQPSSGGEDGAEQQSWLDRWTSRTPAVTRVTLFTVVGCTVVVWLAGLVPAFSNCPAFVVFDFEVYRVLTAALMQPSIFGFLFFILAFGQTGPDVERSLGSLHMLHFMVLASVVSNVLVVVLMLVLGYAVDPSWLMQCNSGCWPMVLGLIALQCSRDPETVRGFPCPVQNKYYPWLLVALFSVFGGGIAFDALFGVLLGYAYAWGWLERMTPSVARVSEWEEGCCASLYALPGFLPAGSGMGTAEGVSGAQAAAGGWVANARGRGEDSASNGNSTYLVRGPGSSHAPTGANQGDASSAFPGGGQTLGSAGTGASASSAWFGGAAPPAVPSDQKAKREAAAAAAAARLERSARGGSGTDSGTPPATAAATSPVDARVADESVGLLEAMGLSREAAVAALQRHGGDVDAAAAEVAQV